MATTQTKLVGFCLGDKANYNATAYANHIWFDPTNKQILLNGIEYIPKKLSELVNDKNFLTSITKSMVEGVLTGNITSHTHSYLPLSGGTMSNTNKVTNLNADLLDGLGYDNFVRNQHITSTSTTSVDANDVWDNAVKHDYRWKNVPNNGIASLLDLTYSQDWRSQIFIQPTSLLKIYARARYSGTTWTAWHQIAFTDSNVATATALTSSAGSATQPIYFSNGKPVACSYTLGKSVPSNAVFTDTTYSVATASADGLMSAAMFKAQMVKSVGVQQGAEMVKPDGTITITDHSVYITQDKSNINGVYQTASGDNDVKIPNATKDYDGSMSYTDKRKLSHVSDNGYCTVASVFTMNVNGSYSNLDALNGVEFSASDFAGMAGVLGNNNESVQPEFIRLKLLSTGVVYGYTLYESNNYLDVYKYVCYPHNSEIVYDGGMVYIQPIS